jgi:hypothetical protein
MLVVFLVTYIDSLIFTWPAYSFFPWIILNIFWPILWSCRIFLGFMPFEKEITEQTNDIY